MTLIDFAVRQGKGFRSESKQIHRRNLGPWWWPRRLEEHMVLRSRFCALLHLMPCPVPIVAVETRRRPESRLSVTELESFDHLVARSQFSQ
ncbi:hypothetical protein BCR41DRAFT_75955 [Lobosporangium transversale]|uniref:Uncharacterized protein n=1 Tax=Lobosporangium transversale TaxID=64571 RepID=A0A1Y2H1V0_9FUNG|nr:hypothetical protein BCR41DRAFT_75955 [Lobosporangium transversale]ORZ28538.1 hypothetical protein BCR41DRAFT_75955 [Lobosporangium transversale]|eukprot:XP_021886223.1 hypothetical protein BCR41DRAFT_75955 [Lobosporangium transversale]